ncbi:lipopolysaccharide biosynthesis protein [Hymenobacter sp. H14-R3]|uniref:lipopolysaccharide biosynthesis protein n=1 Tax=Hymenobacter sp. H14-R3 TaxID=3046308 RepID=UPI0024BA194F|nr:lipopolysaccharide biosynthesis protein [Hymenobacter sp. H14-R3]MDJ0367190.1 lipopolysaccharide biosynthesis protein [Hymenobacter sp. H14-R3]
MTTGTQPTSLGATALRGIKWTTTAAVLTSVMQVGYTAVMARLLDPAAFGLVALAGVVLRFGSYFAEMGLGHAVVQRPQLSPNDLRAAFTGSLLLGLVVAAAFWLLAPLAVLILDNPAVVPLVRALALGFVITSVGLTATSVLRREMRFDLLAKLDVVTYVLAYGGVGLGCAWAGAGVWSLVAATLAQQLIASVAAYTLVRHPVRPLLGWQHYATLVGYGSRVSAISFLEFISGSLDTLLIGRLLGPVALGLYNRAYLLLYLPMYFLTHSIAKVAFPAFSRVQENVPQLRGMYLRSTTLVATLVLPLCAGVAVAAPEMVRVLLGAKWAASVPVLQALCVAVPLSMTAMFAGIVADARANLHRKVVLNLEAIVILASLFWLLRGYGILGVAVALGLSEALRTLLYMRVTHHDVQASYGALFGVYLPGLRNAAVVGAGIWLVSAGLRPLGWPPVLVFGLQMLAGAGALAALLLAWPPPELHAGLWQALRRAQAAPRLPAWARTGLHRYAAHLGPAAGLTAPVPNPVLTGSEALLA